MLDFSSLTAVASNDGDNSYSFVGIEEGLLRLPKGCIAWADTVNNIHAPIEKFAAMRAAFLALYKTLRVYRQNRQQNLVNDSDSAQIGLQGGIELLGEHEGGEIMYYRHLDMLDSILDAHDELGILSLAQRLGRSERLDSTKLHRYLDRAIYLEGGDFFIDEMVMPRHQVIIEPVEIVQMYCFALVEVKRLLNASDMLSSDIRVLGGQFFEHHLATGDGLFEFDTWFHTREILRERLSIIDKHTAFKDDEYHALYDALSSFLHGSVAQGNHGRQWGISTFSPVWESLCITHLINQFTNAIVACDTTAFPDSSPPIPNTLTHKQELRLDSRLVARLHSLPSLSGVFIVNGICLFPDCVMVEKLLDMVQLKLYRYYEVQSLSDNRKTVTPQVDVAFLGFWQGIKSLHGPTQRVEAPKLFAFLQTTEPDPLTAFFLGRAIGAAYESSDGPFDSRQRTFNQLIDAVIGTPRHINILRGIIWETYFDKDDCLRDEDDLAARKDLYGFKYAMQCISKNGASFLELQELLKLVEDCDAIVREEAGEIPKKCIVVDFKYLTSSYFDQNVVEVRERSVRKQFVYEYLLSSKLTADHYRISSEFWIPTFEANAPKVDIDVTYSECLGKCIPIRHINVARLMEEYTHE